MAGIKRFLFYFDEFKLAINNDKITCNIDGTNHIIDHQFCTLYYDQGTSTFKSCTADQVGCSSYSTEMEFGITTRNKCVTGTTDGSKWCNMLDSGYGEYNYLKLDLSTGEVVPKSCTSINDEDTNFIVDTD